MSSKARGLIVVAMMALLAALFLVSTMRESTENTVRIGSKHFTEQEILGEMMSLMIEENTDLDVRRRLNLGGTMICFNALNAGDLDLYAEYTGTGLVSILDREVITDPDEAYAAVQEAFAEKYGLVWLEPFGFNNTYTLTMRREQAQELGIETISDLVRHAPTLRAAFDAEFLTRPDGWEGLRVEYGLSFQAPPRQMDPGLMYLVVAEGEVDVIDGFATDGRIPAYDLVILEDDRGFFPPYHAAPLVREDSLQRYPHIREQLERLAGRLSDATMRDLNYEVDEKGRRAGEVAREFLLSEGLIGE